MPEVFRVDILRVVDGDTYVVRVHLPLGVSKEERVRLAGVDAPERNTPEGKAAKEWAQRFVGSAAILHAAGRDKYGRLIGSITTSAHGILADVLIRAGHARLAQIEIEEPIDGW